MALPNFCHFSGPRFLLARKIEFLHHNFTVFDDQFYSIYGKDNFRIPVIVKERHFSGFLGHTIQGFQGALDSFQGFQGQLDTLHLQDKLVSYVHSKSSIL